MTNEQKEIILEILQKGYLANLATQDDGGLWVSPVIFVHDDSYNIYWMSDPDVRHSKAIALQPQIACSIIASHESKNELALQISGVAEKIDGVRFDLAKLHAAKRGKPEPKAEDDMLQGDSWYKLQPQHIDIICGRLWGFKKQRLDL